MSFQLHSSDFPDQSELPLIFTCFDDNPQIPHLQWSGVPEGTRSFILFFVDIDAPFGDGTYYHLILYNLPGSLRNFGPDTNVGATTYNSADELGYRPPCPPKGNLHRYIFILLAMDTIYPVYSEYGYPKIDEILTFARSHQLGMATLTTFLKK